MHIGKPEISATITEGLFGVVDTHQVQDCCMEIVYVHSVFHRVPAEFVGGSVRHSAFHSTTCHPERIAVWVMFSSIGALTSGSASKFPTPYDQSIL